jgi:hypothetical protein
MRLSRYDASGNPMFEEDVKVAPPRSRLARLRDVIMRY